jgi:hypothetical protein
MLASLAFRVSKHWILGACFLLAWRPWTFENEEGRVHVGFADFSPAKI